MSIGPIPQSIVNMGNILESDNSGSDAECDEDTRAVRHEERSQGDGRESDADDVIDQLNANILRRTDLSKSTLPNSTRAVQQPLSATVNKRHNEKSQSQLSTLKMESPKQLPPKGQLIPLKPERIPKASPISNDEYASSVNKQREPKFVPYEPYAGAVRPMTEDYRKHSRKPSSSSTVSGVSAGYSQNTPSAASNSNSHTQKSGHDNSLEAQINHYKNQTHSVTLMKERLKIAEKDIAELQVENARLKKLMVDSMLGASNAHMVPKGSYEAEAGISGDSFENLNDEIEVWRSKFLSSCILVDQLTKESRDMKTQISSAVHLFREIKNTAGLTASLFDQINNWLSHNASQLDYNYNSSNDDYNYDLSPHPSSPYS